MIFNDLDLLFFGPFFKTPHDIQKTLHQLRAPAYRKVKAWITSQSEGEKDGDDGNDEPVDTSHHNSPGKRPRDSRASNSNDDHDGSDDSSEADPDGGGGGGGDDDEIMNEIEAEDHKEGEVSAEEKKKIRRKERRMARQRIKKKMKQLKVLTPSAVSKVVSAWLKKKELVCDERRRGRMAWLEANPQKAVSCCAQ